VSLGADNVVCKGEFVEAMRDRLDADGLPGSNVDEPGVNKNLGALGQAVFRIATVHAQTTSTAASDAAFWQWVSNVTAWLTAVDAWQNGVTAAFTAWTPTTAPEIALKTALSAVPVPGPPPAAAPAALGGRIV
jgi:hypothetical protein